MKSNMSRLVSKFCLRQILFCLVCSVSLVLFLNQPSLNDYVSTVLAEPPRIELVAEIHQLERHKLLHEKCHNLAQVQANQSKRNVTTSVIFNVDDRHRAIYCDVPKVASTNLKGLMLILSGQVETDDLSSIPRLTVHEKNPMRVLHANNLNDTVKNGVGDFLKFIFVRHPFERLVSAYQDKLARDNPIYHKMVGKVIVRKHRKNPSPLSLEMGNDVTFVIDEWRDGKRPLDVHWRPVIDLCLPCDMQFDFIGKFETLNQDVHFLLGKLNETDLSRLFAGQPKAKTTSSKWKEFMNKISHQQLIDLNQMYADDFRLFGYPHYYTGKEPLQ